MKVSATGDFAKTKWKKLIIIGAAAIFVLVILLNSFTVVQAGHTGVVVTMGSVNEGVLQEGIHFKVPFVQNVVKIDNRIQKLEVNTEAFSKDLQSVKTVLAINYRVDTAKSYSIYKNIGADYENVLVVPAVNEVLKAITSQYTAEEMELLEQLAKRYHEVLTLLGEDPTRDGLQKTPMRVAKAMKVLTRGYQQDPHKVLTDALFEEKYNQMVIVKDIDFFSMCEHHMLPFYGKAHVAYIPNGYITGLSKVARVVDIYSHRLQVQERLTQQIKDCIQETLHPLGVMVVVEAKHMCMQMRGVEKQNSITTTSDFSGAFNQAKTREEFMNLLRGESKRI